MIDATKWGYMISEARVQSICSECNRLHRDMSLILLKECYLTCGCTFFSLAVFMM